MFKLFCVEGVQVTIPGYLYIVHVDSYLSSLQEWFGGCLPGPLEAFGHQDIWPSWCFEGKNRLELLPTLYLAFASQLVNDWEQTSKSIYQEFERHSLQIFLPSISGNWKSFRSFQDPVWRKASWAMFLCQKRRLQWYIAHWFVVTGKRGCCWYAD